MITCYRITIFIYIWSFVITYHDVSRNWKRLPVLGWTPQIKSCNRCVTSSVHPRYPTIQLTQSRGILSYHINSTHSHSIEWNQVSRCSLRWTWAKNTTKSAGGLKYLWLIISAADVPGLLGREVSLCRSSSRFFFTNILPPDGVPAPVALCYSKCTLEAHRPKTCRRRGASGCPRMAG